MKTLNPLTIEKAPAGSKETLQAIQEDNGFIPNMMATLANSPAVLKGYIALDEAWGQSTLTPEEREIILLTASVETNCRYCVAEHATTLKQTLEIDPAMVKAIRTKTAVHDEKANALVMFTREAVKARGLVSESTKAKLHSAGFSEIAMMEILVGIALKTITNYLDHINPVTIDTAFQAEA